jgi:hypothetical protein
MRALRSAPARFQKSRTSTGEKRREARLTPGLGIGVGEPLRHRWRDCLVEASFIWAVLPGAVLLGGRGNTRASEETEQRVRQAALLLKYQLIISNRARERAPNLTLTDRFVLGLTTLFVNPTRIPKLSSMAGLLSKRLTSAQRRKDAGLLAVTKRSFDSPIESAVPFERALSGKGADVRELVTATPDDIAERQRQATLDRQATDGLAPARRVVNRDVDPAGHDGSVTQHGARQDGIREAEDAISRCLG